VGAYSLEDWVRDLRAATGMGEADAAAFLGDFWDVYLGALNAELAARLRALRPRYRTALLSNSFVGAREKEHERFGFGDLTDLIVYSHEEGVAKPERRIYELTCERLGARPDEVVFVDDAEAYIEGARAVGMRTILHRDNAKTLAALEAMLTSSPAQRA
jgi:putative hydrolase of the HAD superfamily